MSIQDDIRKALVEKDSAAIMRMARDGHTSEIRDALMGELRNLAEGHPAASLKAAMETEYGPSPSHAGRIYREHGGMPIDCVTCTEQVPAWYHGQWVCAVMFDRNDPYILDIMSLKDAGVVVCFEDERLTVIPLDNVAGIGDHVPASNLPSVETSDESEIPATENAD